MRDYVRWWEMVLFYMVTTAVAPLGRALAEAWW